MYVPPKNSNRSWNVFQKILISICHYYCHTTAVPELVKLTALTYSPMLILKPPKYDSVREIKIGDILEKALKREIRKRKENILRYGEYYTKTYVDESGTIMQFPATLPVPYKEVWPLSVRENGELLPPHSFKYCARIIHTELNNPLFHSHCLRHTHGTMLAEMGVNPKTIMERLGHKDIQTTLQTYIFNTDKMQDDSVNLIEQAIQSIV